MRNRRGTRSSRARWTAAAVSLSVALVLTACGAPGSPRASASLATGRKVPPLTIGTGSWGTSWSYNPWSASYLWALRGWVQLPLTIQEPTGPGEFLPELATSWKDVHGTLEVTLRRGVRWSTGQPVTSQDVVSETLLNGIDDAQPWADISSVSAAGRYRVDYKLVPGIPLDEAEVAILYNGSPAVPSSLFSRFLSPAVQKLVVSHDRQLRANASTPASSTLDADYKSLVSFNPSTAFSDGPYRLKAVTSSDILLTKSPSYFAAGEVHVPQVEAQATTAATEFGEMMAGEIDLPYVEPSASEMGKALRSGYWHVKAKPQSMYWPFWLNDRRPPFNQVAVRQALAYLIHRPEVLTVQDGKPVLDRYARHPDMQDSLDTAYLTKTQLNSLNSYPYDPTKAAHLLESVGYHKVKGQWMSPDGKPFKLEFDIASGSANGDELGIVVGHWLDNFGIKTTVSVIESTAVDLYMEKGQFQMAWGFPQGYGFFNPMAQFLGPLTFQGTAGSGIGFPAMETVPGLGRVNVVQTLTKEEDTISTTPGSKIDSLVWDWARFFDRELPVIEYSDWYVPRLYSTKNYVDWPPDNTKLGKTLWAIDSEAAPGYLELAMVQHGYIRPR